jgi:hypothetical protein
MPASVEAGSFLAFLPASVAKTSTEGAQRRRDQLIHVDRDYVRGATDIDWRAASPVAAAEKAGQARDRAQAACAGELHATSSAKSGRARAKARPGREATKRGSHCGANLALARRSSLKSE